MSNERQAWSEAVVTTQRAREAVSRAKQILREAEGHYNKCWDTERLLWLAYRQASETKTGV